MFTEQESVLGGLWTSFKNLHAFIIASPMQWQWSFTAAQIMYAAKCEIRAVIYFLRAESLSHTRIHERLSRVYDVKCINIENVRKLCREFETWRAETHDETRSGRCGRSRDTGVIFIWLDDISYNNKNRILFLICTVTAFISPLLWLIVVFVSSLVQLCRWQRNHLYGSFLKIQLKAINSAN